MIRKRIRKGWFSLPKSSFGRGKFQKHCFCYRRNDDDLMPLFDRCPREIYPSQTKIWEGLTNLSELDFEALFKGVSTRFGLQTVEKCFENSFWNVGSAFPNLRLGSINSHMVDGLPKSAFGRGKWSRKIPSSSNVCSHMSKEPHVQAVWKGVATMCDIFFRIGNVRRNVLH